MIQRAHRQQHLHKLFAGEQTETGSYLQGLDVVAGRVNVRSL